MKYEITPKVIEGQKCIAQNYRSRYKTWENGTVRSVEAGLKEDGSFRLTYTVVLDRRGPGKPWNDGSLLFLYVGDDAIEPIKS